MKITIDPVEDQLTPLLDPSPYENGHDVTRRLVVTDRPSATRCDFVMVYAHVVNSDRIARLELASGSLVPAEIGDNIVGFHGQRPYKVQWRGHMPIDSSTFVHWITDAIEDLSEVRASR